MEVYFKTTKHLKLTQPQLLEIANVVMQKPDLGWENCKYAFYGETIDCEVNVKIVDDYKVIITIEME